MERVRRELATETSPPAFDGRTASSAPIALDSFANRIASQQEQENDLAYLPEIPTARWDTFRQH
jgi:hypothetical protein